MIPGLLVLALDSCCQVVEVVSFYLLKLGQVFLSLGRLQFANTTMHGGFVFLLENYFFYFGFPLLELIVTLLADDVCESI